MGIVIDDKESSISGRVSGGRLIHSDCVSYLKDYEGKKFQSIIADPPYFKVLTDEIWDNCWASENEYLDWCLEWATLCVKHLADDGLFFIFGQLGKREHIWLHLCSMLVRNFQFHDSIIWDRVVGYNDRRDSFTPQYENILVLRKRKDSCVFFNKEAVRIEYDEETIQRYLKDKRYQDKDKRESYLRKGKYARNIISIPSLKGSYKEKVGHPAQKPLALIKMLVLCSSREKDVVYDPFMGSGTTALACEILNRKWIGNELSKQYFEMSKKRLENFFIKEGSIFNF